MKKAKKRRRPSETSLARYDWSKARRGTYAGRLAKGPHFVEIEAGVWAAFPSAKEINDALRVLAAAVVRAAGKKQAKRSRRAA